MKPCMVLALVLTLFCLGCKEAALYHELEEKEAIEIIVLLAGYGVEAQKIPVEVDQKQKWNIMVAPAQEAYARKLLVENNLPRKKSPGLAGVCQEKSLIETETKLHCQMVLGKQGEIANALGSVPGVVDAQVVLNIPMPQEFVDQETAVLRPSASVVIKAHSVVASQDLTHERIQQFVAHAVTDLDPRSVSVIISYGDTAAGPDVSVRPTSAVHKEVEEPSLDETEPQAEEDWVKLAGLKMDERSAQKFKILAVLFLLVFSLIAGGLIFVLFRLSTLRSRLGVDENSVSQPQQKTQLPAKIS